MNSRLAIQRLAVLISHRWHASIITIYGCNPRFYSPSHLSQISWIKSIPISEISSHVTFLLSPSHSMCAEETVSKKEGRMYLQRTPQQRYQDPPPPSHSSVRICEHIQHDHYHACRRWLTFWVESSPWWPNLFIAHMSIYGNNHSHFEWNHRHDDPIYL